MVGGVGFLVQCRLELLKVPSSLGLEFWNNYYFNLLKIAFLLKIIEVRQAAKHALRKLFPFIDFANVSQMCIASLTDKPLAKRKNSRHHRHCDIRFQICPYVLSFYQQ